MPSRNALLQEFLTSLSEAFRAGASGYVLKSGGEELITAIREVSEGHTYASAELRAATSTSTPVPE